MTTVVLGRKKTMKWTIKKAETRILEVERKELPKGLTYWAAVDYLSKMRREGKYNA
jgi:hypothetical protein